jgi:hypothetical protein
LRSNALVVGAADRAWPGLLGAAADQINPTEQAFVERLTTAAPTLAAAVDLAKYFAALIRSGDTAPLDD